MSLIDKIAADFEAKPLIAVEVPEWGTTLYFKRMTLAERSALRKGVGKDDDEALMVSLLQARALDAGGNRVFDDSAGTRAKLMGKASADVIARIIAAASPDSVGEVKND